MTAMLTILLAPGGGGQHDASFWSSWFLFLLSGRDNCNFGHLEPLAPHHLRSLVPLALRRPLAPLANQDYRKYLNDGPALGYHLHHLHARARRAPKPCPEPPR